jgi:hypothetical protein
MIDFNTAPFKFEIIVEDLPKTSDGINESKPQGVTIHHSAVAAQDNYDFKALLNIYAKGHLELTGGLAYTFAIGRENSDKIYVCRYFDWHQWHNSNYDLNQITRGILVDGNFQEQSPSELQLKKLRFLLDCLSDNAFSANGWANTLDGINPKDNNKVLTGGGKSVKTLHYHNEAAQAGNATACCGNNLIPYVDDYRTKNGNVDWGVYWTAPQPQPQPDPVKITILESDYYALVNGQIAAEKERDDFRSKWNQSTDTYQKYVICTEKNKIELQAQLKQAQNYAGEQKQKADDMEQRALKAEQALKEVSSNIATSSKFWEWLIVQARQFRYFITNAFWSFLILILTLVPQVAIPESDIAIWISQNWGYIGTIVIAFFSNSAVQAYFKNKHKQIENRKLLEETLKI